MAAKIPIDREQIAEFCRRNGIRRLALFGSVLPEDFRPESDVDVVEDDCMKQNETTSSLGRVDRAAYYEGLLDEGSRRGLSMRELAMRHGVSTWTLYEWKRRLDAERRERKAPSRFVAVDVVDPSRGELEASVCYEVILPDGCRVRVPSSFSGARVAELIAAVRSC